MVKIEYTGVKTVAMEDLPQGATFRFPHSPQICMKGKKEETAYVIMDLTTGESSKESPSFKVVPVEVRILIAEDNPE